MAWESPYVEQYPNPEIRADRGKVIGALIILWIFGLLNIAVGGVFLFAPEVIFGAQVVKLPKEIIYGLGLFSLAWGGVYYVICAILMSAKKSAGAAKTAFVMACIELGLGILSFNIINIGLNVLKVWLIKRGSDALAEVKLRVYAELLEQNDPAQFAHLGSDVAAQVQENRAVTERGYKLLLGEA
jgi:hypothetical protein